MAVDSASHYNETIRSSSSLFFVSSSDGLQPKERPKWHSSGDLFLLVVGAPEVNAHRLQKHPLIPLTLKSTTSYNTPVERECRLDMIET